MRADPQRLDTLRRLMLLDSQPEQDWDAIAQRAADVLGVPIAMCAHDFVPRQVRDDALENMRVLAAAVMELMMLRHQRATPA